MFVCQRYIESIQINYEYGIRQFCYFLGRFWGFQNVTCFIFGRYFISRIIMRYVFSTVIFLCIHIICVAQQTDNCYYFKNISIRDGLSQNTVSAILQDKKGFMWFGTKDGLNRYDGQTFRVFKHDLHNKQSIGNNFITALYEDADGNIWVGTDAGIYVYQPEKESFEQFMQSSTKGTKIERAISMITDDKDGNIWIAVESQGLFCYNPQNSLLNNYILSDSKQVSSNVKCFAVDNSGTMWIGFYGDGLFYSKDNMETIVPFVSSDNEETFKNDVVTKILQGPYNRLYIGSLKGGVKELNLTSGKISNLLLTDENGENIFFREFILCSENELWIGTESGVYIYNLRTKKLIHLQSSAYDIYALSDNAIYSLYKDREEGIWLGSYFGGINYFPKQYTYFEKFYSRNSGDGLHGKRVREFCQDKNGILWIGTEDGGLNTFNPHTNKFRYFNPSKAFTNIHGLCMDGDNLWVGTFSRGVKIINTKTGTIIKSYKKEDKSSKSLSDNSVFAICKTSSGDIYLGTLLGLHRYNRQNDNFEYIRELTGKFVYDIKEDSYGNLWIATYANGAYCYDINAKKWNNYLYDEKDSTSLPYNKVISVFEDSRHRIWLTTQGGGFCEFNPEMGNFVRYSSKDGLPNDVVYQMLEDSDGFLWLTTNNGLVRFNPQNKEFRAFTTANGLLGNQFNYRSSFNDNNGKLYFGSIDGFIAFNPKSFTENKYIPPIVITDFLLFNKKVPVNSPKSPLKKSVTFSDTITLNANQNSFSLRIAALGYQELQINKLIYKLDGFDREWNFVNESFMVNYSNLRHGNYVFKVKASHDNGTSDGSETTLFIQILPPFYLSMWAYFIYIFVSIGCATCIFLYFKRRSYKKHFHQMEKFEQEKEREIYNAKIEFFTNVAHEIRTPLTLIKGPLENIILKKEVDFETKEDLNIMSQNTERLLSLINQLLDFRRTEHQGFRLNFIECNISEILKETQTRFTSLSKQRNIEFTLNIPEVDFYAHVDKEAFTKIISNLFNNAIKYSSSYIHVTLEIDVYGENKCFHIYTKNDGIIVPDEMKEEIFKPFVQFNAGNTNKIAAGTGIGLALSRSLAELHQGTLYMVKGENCNSFCLTLPSIQNNAINLTSEPILRTDEIVKQPFVEKMKTVASRQTVLVVEDNLDMLSFITRQLSVEYSVLAAENGRNALEILDNNYVSLIVSDVVMPQMDGFELCRMIKSNISYSHIPLILLTAKTNIQSKIEGLELGADAYIEKPFSMEYLQANIVSLINNREKLREAFTKSPFIAVNTVAITKADEEFVRKLDEIIQNNLDNPDFSMEDIADMLNMSRSSFYRKIKGVLNLTPNDYLRLERLKKAAQLLKEGERRINEICYTVGFNSPSYFTKCFLKQFGVLPKDFQG